MIKRVSNLLYQLRLREEKLLGKETVRHGPTIGNMYEGLTKSLLSTAMPIGKELALVDGFVEGKSGELSRQIDCMLVRGSGTRIPHTKSYKWPIPDVIAVFEIKKSLHSREMLSSQGVLETVTDLFKPIFETARPKLTTNPVENFIQLTGRLPRKFEEDGGIDNEIINNLLFDLFVPIRVVFAYDGYSSEEALRKGFIKYLEPKILGDEIVVPSYLPELVICGNFAIIKLNTQPYVGSMQEDWWPIYASSPSNPLALLLEVLFSRLASDGITPVIFEDDLSDNTLNDLMKMKFVVESEGVLNCHYAVLPHRVKPRQGENREWEPFMMSAEEWALACVVQDFGPIDQQDPKFTRWLRQTGIDLDLALHRLREKRLIIANDNKLLCPVERFFSQITSGNIFVAHEINKNKLESFAKRIAANRTEKPSQIASEAGRLLRLWHYPE